MFQNVKPNLIFSTQQNTAVPIILQLDPLKFLTKYCSFPRVLYP